MALRPRPAVGCLQMPSFRAVLTLSRSDLPGRPPKSGLGSSATACACICANAPPPLAGCLPASISLANLSASSRCFWGMRFGSIVVTLSCVYSAMEASCGTGSMAWLPGTGSLMWSLSLPGAPKSSHSMGTLYACKDSTSLPAMIKVGMTSPLFWPFFCSRASCNTMLLLWSCEQL